MENICKQVSDNGTTPEEKEKKLNDTNVRFIFRNHQVDPMYHSRNSPYLVHEHLEGRLMPMKKFLDPPNSTVADGSEHDKQDHEEIIEEIGHEVGDVGPYPNDRRNKWKQPV